MNDDQSPVIVGISGASGAILGVRVLEALRTAHIPTHLVVTKSAALTIGYELDMSLPEIRSLAETCHSVNDIGASIASGSFVTRGMIIAPCSMNSLAAITHGITENLLTRAADVVLKERRKLVLMVREAPFHLGHLRNMAAVTEMGAIVAPPIMAFYNRPETIDDMVDHTVGRALDLLGINTTIVKRWQGKPPNRVS
jgi:4-hydroxy-3-polyprenylbenzoate decarboxylase